MFGGSMEELPLDDDYYGIRRTLWLSTDGEYKKVAELFSRKLTILKQQTLSAEDSLPDFCKVNKTLLNIPNNRKFDFNKADWEKTAIELSSLFSNYKDIFHSSVTINFFDADVYFINSEGTEIEQPITIAAVSAKASTMANDGEPLSDDVTYYEITLGELPSLDIMKKDVQNMADKLVSLKTAPVFEDSYTGPVLFEDQAAAEIFNQRLFTSNGGIVANRKGIYANPQIMMFMSQTADKSMEDKMNHKIVASSLTIKDEPKMNTFQGKNLIGSFAADAEGVIPEDLTLVDKGTLKSMLNGRTPALNSATTNGHNGYTFIGHSLMPATGPAVASITADETSSLNDLKSKLIAKAKDEDLKYAYIVKKVKSSSAGGDEGLSIASIMTFASGMQKKGGLSKPIEIYRVNVADGKEELVRSSQMSGFNVASLKKLLGASGTPYVYNTLHADQGGGMSGMFSFAIGFSSAYEGGLSGKPISIIAPNALLVDEVDIQKEQRPINAKPPIVENPVGK